jgi:HAE1 family hydrophobic/amphiphilic exporter-1
VKLTPPAERDASQQAVMVSARQALAPTYGVQVAVLDAGGLGGAQAPISIDIRGPEIDQLQALSEQIAAQARQIPGIVDVQTSLDEPRPEFRIDVRRDVANEVGLDVGQVAATVRPFLAGQDVTRWEDPTGEERDVVVQAPPGLRVSPRDLAGLPVATSRRGPDGAAITVPLGDVAVLEQGTAPAQINRQRMQRVASVTAGIAGDLSVAEASAAIRERLAALPRVRPGRGRRLGLHAAHHREPARGAGPRDRLSRHADRGARCRGEPPRRPWPPARHVHGPGRSQPNEPLHRARVQ